MDKKVLDKINKLLALSSSDFEGESNTAMEMATRLMEENGIDWSQLNSAKLEDDLGPLGSQMWDSKHTRSPSSWEKLLGQIVAHHFGCVYFTRSVIEDTYHGKPRKRYTPVFCGHEGNRRTSLIIWEWLRKRIREEARTKSPWDIKGFCSGAVKELMDKYPLGDKKEAETGDNSLMVLDQVKQWVKDNCDLSKGRALTLGGSSESMRMGREMAKDLTLNRQFGLKAITA